jgi:hypothetical protein
MPRHPDAPKGRFYALRLPQQTGLFRARNKGVARGVVSMLQTVARNCCPQKLRVLISEKGMTPP